jgi:leucyl aminopeptidase
MIELSLMDVKDLPAAMPLGFVALEGGSILGGAGIASGLLKEIAARAEADGFRGQRDETAFLSIFWEGLERRALLAGAGPKAQFGGESLRRACGALANAAKRRFEVFAFDPAGRIREAAEGMMLASYSFNEYKKAEGMRLKGANLLVRRGSERRTAEKALERARLSCEAVFLARDLGNRAPSDKPPRALAKFAKSLEGSGLSVEVLGPKEMSRLGMGALLGVSRGSAQPGAFVHLSYRGPGAKRKIGLLGKGITFDSGGLSLKPPAGMETMKRDMAGAAAVLAVLKVLPRLKPKLEVHGFCAFSYNMPGPDALKPGDVVRAMNGRTIEVLNTDAEGRLVLADALSYAVREKMDALIDVATLTGAAVTALGPQVGAAMGTDRALMRGLLEASRRAGEILCEFPLVADYKEWLKSPVADLCNIGRVRGEGGTVIGGLFLEEFAGGLPWVHLDISGPSWSSSGGPLAAQGATGAIVRTLIEFLCP